MGVVADLVNANDSRRTSMIVSPEKKRWSPEFLLWTLRIYSESIRTRCMCWLMLCLWSTVTHVELSRIIHLVTSTITRKKRQFWNLSLMFSGYTLGTHLATRVSHSPWARYVVLTRVKRNQLDTQFILSIFRQPLHVSGVSMSIIRRYNRMYTTILVPIQPGQQRVVYKE